MKTKLNDNEVREIAEMQKKIDSYEGFIYAVYAMMLSEREIKFPLFTGTNLDKEMIGILQWIKTHKEYKNENAKQRLSVRNA
jgi:hypothetical protein